MYKKLLNEIKKVESIVIFRHTNPDGDAFGSSLGLQEIIQENFPKKKVFIGSLQTTKFTNKFFPKTNKISDDIIENSLLIITDTANTERIDGPEIDYSKSIKIDHHPNIDDYGKMFVGGDHYSSASEIITEFAIKNKLKISNKAAKYLYIGIVTDTGRFQYESTSRKTHELTGILIEKDFDVKEIFSKMLNKSENQIKFNSKLQTNIKYEGKVAYVIMPKKLNDKYNIDYSSASSSVYLVMGAEETKYGLFASKDPETGKYRVSIRSKEKAINKIAEYFGGGGHAMASGIKLNNKKQIKEVLLKLKEL